ncbi:unnamed protein product [Brassicogethes aeneus]|uniref:Non-structural maintenance of chromosomes element 1 homolog n=1 Tax=Brassicogethes aeneus TaxID=1431903 RepID=A0A9P0BD75_BRAAE|nr:unnamed protein product [Brassicogethes aeneus]
MENPHRYFLQYMLKNGVCNKVAALKYCKKLDNDNIKDIDDLKSLVIKINREIGKQSLKITYGTCEVTNQEMIVMLNTKNDALAKLQISFTPAHLEYFQAILGEILNSENYRITFIVCLNLTSTLVLSLSRDKGQVVFDKWVKGGYFVKDQNHVYLGLRTIFEFTSYLRSHCPNSLCKLCNELVFIGKSCSKCSMVFHGYCITKYLKNQVSCPSCDLKWESNDGLENSGIDDSTAENDDISVNNQSQNDTDNESVTDEPGPSSRKHRRRI